MKRQSPVREAGRAFFLDADPSLLGGGVPKEGRATTEGRRGLCRFMWIPPPGLQPSAARLNPSLSAEIKARQPQVAGPFSWAPTKACFREAIRKKVQKRTQWAPGLWSLWEPPHGLDRA